MFAGSAAKPPEWRKRRLFQVALKLEAGEVGTDVARIKIAKYSLSELNMEYRQAVAAVAVEALLLLAERYSVLGIPPAARPMPADRLPKGDELEELASVLMAADAEWLFRRMSHWPLNERQRKMLKRCYSRWPERAAPACRAPPGALGLRNALRRRLSRYELPAAVIKGCAVMRLDGFAATVKSQRDEDRLRLLLSDKRSSGGWLSNNGRYKPGGWSVVERRVFLWRLGEAGVVAVEAAQLWALTVDGVDAAREGRLLTKEMVRQDWARARKALRGKRRKRKKKAKPVAPLKA